MEMQLNRAQRRSMEKKGKGASAGDLRYLQTPCTITEAAQIARGVAEDVVQDYSRAESHLKIAMSLQIEILKEIIISSGLMTEEQFREKYMARAEEFNRMHQEMMSQSAEGEEVEQSTEPAMEMNASELEVAITE